MTTFGKTISDFKEKNSSKITIKIILIAALVIVLQIPISMVESLIHERKARQDQAVEETTQIWGRQQSLLGPILTIPYVETWKDSGGYVRTHIQTAHFLPEYIHFQGHIIPQIRYRGNFEVMLYETSIKVFGNFVAPNFQQWNIEEADVIWDKATISLGVPDKVGIQNEIDFQWNDDSLEIHPDVSTFDLLNSGFHANLPTLDYSEHPNAYEFEIELVLQGSDSFQVFPIGKETTAHFSSPWAHPSFVGSYLPDIRNIQEDGFDADWNLTYLVRDYPQQWLTKYNPPEKLIPNVDASAFGVQLVQPANVYQQSTRSIKYGILFVALTFLAFFLFEVMNSLRIHPLQYLLVGFAICLFYLILVSLSEHIEFIYAYIIATTATIFLISSYVRKVLDSTIRASAISAILVGLYSYLFILLQLEDYALVFGTIGLFVVLGVVMYITREVNWYAPHLLSNSRSASHPEVDKFLETIK